MDVGADDDFEDMSEGDDDDEVCHAATPSKTAIAHCQATWAYWRIIWAYRLEHGQLPSHNAADSAGKLIVYDAALTGSLDICGQRHEEAE